jgi:hypothetical protein
MIGMPRATEVIAEARKVPLGQRRSDALGKLDGCEGALLSSGRPDRNETCSVELSHMVRLGGRKWTATQPAPDGADR